MLLIVTRNITGYASHVPMLCKSLDERKIPYIITKKCDPDIKKRKDILGIILPGSVYRIHSDEYQPELDIELYYLFHFPKTPILGLCHGCQFLMLYYGGGLLQYKNYWSGSKDVELDLSIDHIFHGEDKNQKLRVYFHDLPVVTPEAASSGVREIAWLTSFRDHRRRACAFEFEKDRVYGFMFHPEAKKETRTILYNFYDKVCHRG